jgi:hypothetical protein
MLVTVYFDWAFDENDETLTRIVTMFGGETGDSGVGLVGPYADQRDVECEIPDDKKVACLAKLRKAGFTVEETVWSRF